MSDTDTRTATQKIQDLENVVSALYQAAAQNKNVLESLLKAQGNMALVKDALKLLNKKTEAIILAATSPTGITQEAVSSAVVKMSVDDLTAQVKAYVENGHLVAAEAVADDGYLVCEEYDTEGTLANPRIQFRLDSQDDNTKSILRGLKAGDTASFGGDKFTAKILEVYTITEPKADAAPEAPAAESSPAETATADTASA